ncbi:MAG: nonstructural protein [Arizlama microvirus]|nr:MAG: nonstructural protein [Arizlama microvirus]
MKRFVVAVYDSAVHSYGQPFFVPAVGAALRSFIDEVNRAAPDNMLYQHPEDYELFVLATFDDEAGIFEIPEEGMRNLARGKDVKKELQ